MNINELPEYKKAASALKSAGFRFNITGLPDHQTLTVAIKADDEDEAQKRKAEQIIQSLGGKKKHDWSIYGSGFDQAFFDISAPSWKKAKKEEMFNSEEHTASNLAAPLSAHEATKLLMGKRTKANQYAKVEPGTLYYRALGAIYAVPDTDVNRAAIEAIGSRVLPLKEGGVVGNGEVVENACNRNTPLKKVDYQLEDVYGSNATLGDLIDEYKRNKAVSLIDKEADTMARDKVYDALEAITGIKCKWATASRNSVVSNALAWKRGVANSVCNAKFKVGDRVRLKKYGNQIGTIIRLGHNINGKNNLVKFDDGSFADDIFKDGELELLANSSGAVANAPIFKVYRRIDGKWAFSPDRKLRIFDTYEEAMDAAEKTVGYNSRNAVVNAALAWKKAANFQPLPSFKVGQKVKFWDRNQAAYYDGIYSVKKVLNPYEVELEGSDGKMRPGNKCDVRRIVAA